MSTTQMNVFQRMAAITAEITAVAKNLNVGYGQSSYKAVGEADVLYAVRKAEAKFGIYSYPANREIVESRVVETEAEFRGQRQVKKTIFMRIKTVYRFVNIDQPEEYIDIVSYGDGVDAQDKGPGKAMTYGDKYALMKAYKIITGEDPDQYASEPAVTTQDAAPQEQASASGPARQARQAHPVAYQYTPSGLTLDSPVEAWQAVQADTSRGVATPNQLNAIQKLCQKKGVTIPYTRLGIEDPATLSKVCASALLDALAK